MPLLRGAIGTAGQVLRGNTNYILLLSGQITSATGERIALLAVSWWILEETGRPELLAVAMMFSTLATVFLSPVAGILADRLNRVFILVATDAFRGVVMLGLAYLQITGGLTLPILYGGMVLTGAATALFTPTSTALIPNIVSRDRLIQANSAFQTGNHVAGFAGYAAGGLVLYAMGVSGSFVVCGLAYMVSAAWEALIRIPFVRPSRQPGFLLQLREGLTYVLSQSIILRMFLAFGFINFFSSPLSPVLIPSVVKEVLGLGQVHLGLATSAVVGGVLVSSIALGIWGHRVRAKGQILLISLLVIGAGIFGMGMTLSEMFLAAAGRWGAFSFFVALGFITGLAAGAVNISITTYMQETVPDAKRGRVFGLTTTMALGVQPAAAGFVALLLGYLSESSILVFGGFAVSLAALYLVRSPGISKI